MTDAVIVTTEKPHPMFQPGEHVEYDGRTWTIDERREREDGLTDLVLIRLHRASA